MFLYASSFPLCLLLTIGTQSSHGIQKCLLQKDLNDWVFNVVALGDGAVDIGMPDHASQPILPETKRSREVLRALGR